MSSVAFDIVAGFFRALDSTLSAKTKSVLVTLAGGAGFDSSDRSDEAGEIAQNQLAYSALGIISRPRAPEKGEQADVIGLRRADGVVPIAWHDIRIDRAFPDGPAKGTVALVGYGGGFHSLTDTPTNSGDQKATVHVIYAPYQFTAGVPAKAHTIVTDTTPGNESVQVVHGDGYFITMNAGKGIQMLVDEHTSIQIEPSSVPGTPGKIKLMGQVIATNLTVGDAATAAPALPGVGFLGCPFLFLSV
jgi:hypothetical protein